MIQHLSVLFIASGLLAVASASAFATCSVASFGEKKGASCSGPKCLSFTPPKEIAAISRGVYSEYVGLFINDGFARWVGLDLNHSEIIEVERFAGKQLQAALKQMRKMKQSAIHYKRETRNGKLHFLDVIHKRTIDRSAIGDIICVANGLWADIPDVDRVPELVRMSDSHNKLYLVDGVAIKGFGGPGAPPEPARKLHDSLDALRRQI